MDEGEARNDSLYRRGVLGNVGGGIRSSVTWGVDSGEVEPWQVVDSEGSLKGSEEGVSRRVVGELDGFKEPYGREGVFQDLDEVEVPGWLSKEEEGVDS